MRARFALVLAALTLAGCGASEAADPGNGPRAPAEPPPDPGLGGAPPPAWIATERGPVWLAYATFCWEGGCADAGAPECGRAPIPDVRVERGERVRFHLGFEPQRAELTFYARGGGTSGSAMPLERAPTIGWTAEHEGPFWLSTWADEGDAHYAGCLRFETPVLTIEEALARGSGEVAVRGTLHVEEDEVRLCDGLAESYPPQCPTRSLLLEGFDIDAAALAREGDVAWGEEPTTVSGRLEGTTLTVAP